jgi:hypothetical protein
MKIKYISVQEIAKKTKMTISNALMWLEREHFVYGTPTPHQLPNSGLTVYASDEIDQLLNKREN